MTFPRFGAFLSGLTCAALQAATIVGTIRDPSGAVIPNVTVELRADTSGKQTLLRADTSGGFRAPGLPAGPYHIKIDHPGFQTYTEDAVLEDNQTNAFEFHLEIAKVEQKLSVASKGVAGANSDPNYKALRSAQIAETFAVDNLTLHRDAGSFTLRSGTIGFGPAVLGKVTLAVFIGEGEFALKPAHWTETQQLKRFLNRDSIAESFRQLVLSFTDDTYEEVRRAAKSAPAEPRAAQALQDFRRQARLRPEVPRSMLEALLTESSIANVEAETLAGLYNPARPGFFSAYITGRQHSHLRFHLKPGGALPQLPAPEEVAVVNLDPQTEQEGIWYLCHTIDEIAKHTASPHEEKRVVSPQKYRIETSIARNDHLTAVADFRFRAVSNGDRLVSFDLLPSLRVTRVTLDGQIEAASSRRTAEPTAASTSSCPSRWRRDASTAWSSNIAATRWSTNPAVETSVSARGQVGTPA